MAQADTITTAIRELMSRGQPPKSTNPVRAAHAEFVAALAGNAPQPIRSVFDPADLDDRADHLQKVLAALHVYVAAITAELAQKFPAASVDRPSSQAVLAPHYSTYHKSSGARRYVRPDLTGVWRFRFAVLMNNAG